MPSAEEYRVEPDKKVADPVVKFHMQSEYAGSFAKLGRNPYILDRMDGL